VSSSQTLNKVPLGQKIAFGIGMFANQMFPAILSIFFVVLVEDLGFSGWMWAFVALFPRIFDAITDPIMGFISDNTKSKYGRRKIYVIIGGIVMESKQTEPSSIQLLVFLFLVGSLLFGIDHF
jgi:GPH family glycoside/pentoside/hexuronide:cation symporter